jgi:hypothetical protein
VKDPRAERDAQAVPELGAPEQLQLVVQLERVRESAERVALEQPAAEEVQGRTQH